MHNRNLPRRLWQAISVLILPLALFGCIDFGQTAQRGSNLFSVTLYSSKRCAAPNEVLTLRATVTNKTNETRVIELPDRPVFDIVIGNADAADAIRWSDGKPLAEVNRLELGPGESKSIEINWVSDGITHVGAVFISDARSPDNVMFPGFIIPLTNMNCPRFVGP